MEVRTPENQKFNYWLSTAFSFFAILIVGALIYSAGLKSLNQKQTASVLKTTSDLEKKILPTKGVRLPVKWGNLGKRLVESGAIDANKFEMIYESRGGLNSEEKNLLYGENNENLTINSQNAGYILNLLWALGLGNKNEILEKGPMMDSQYGGAGRFASTGGWTISVGDAMAHYSKYSLILLNSEQQELVEKVSKNIYRPCCSNSTYFPDCNHGMAMLGLLELMAAQGASEERMYQAALAVNSYWFPDTYLTIAKYFEKQGINWEDVNPKEALGSAYSSAFGYQQILSEIEPIKTQEGGSCGV